MTVFERVLVEIVIAAPADVVWHALREPAQIRKWFGWDYPQLEAEVAMIFGAGATASEADRTVRVAGLPDRYTIEPDGPARTIVRLVRAAPAAGPEWNGIYDDTHEGWLTFTQQLRFLLERHPQADRRTLFLNGRVRAADDPLPVHALGLSPVQIVPVGEQYSLTTAPGDRLNGTIWYRSAYQVGMTVDELGDALMIITTRPRTAKSAYGGGTVLVNTYALSPSTFDQLRERWSAWWRTQYEVIEIHPAGP